MGLMFTVMDAVRTRYSASYARNLHHYHHPDKVKDHFLSVTQRFKTYISITGIIEEIPKSCCPCFAGWSPMLAKGFYPSNPYQSSLGVNIVYVYVCLRTIIDLVISSISRLRRY